MCAEEADWKTPVEDGTFFMDFLVDMWKTRNKPVYFRNFLFLFLVSFLLFVWYRNETTRTTCIRLGLVYELQKRVRIAVLPKVEVNAKIKSNIFETYLGDEHGYCFRSNIRCMHVMLMICNHKKNFSSIC